MITLMEKTGDNTHGGDYDSTHGEGMRYYSWRRYMITPMKETDDNTHGGDMR